MLIIGGWVPKLLFPNEAHLGSINVDILFNQRNIEKSEKYENIKRYF